MPRKYLAFDLETAKVVKGRSFSLAKERPLGVSCIATLKSDEADPQLWHGHTDSGTPAERMAPDDFNPFLQYMNEAVEAGYTLLTWNGLGFDFDVLAEESQQADTCKSLALAHVDMLFHVFCEKGFPVSLANAAAGLNVEGKTDGISGMEAPVLWKAGRHQEVLDYVAQDVRATLAVGLAAEEQKQFRWITAKGRPSKFPLRKGWLNVSEARNLPEPDTSWMDRPIPRSNFAGWLDR